MTPGSGRAGPPSTSPMTASARARPGPRGSAAGTSASRAVAQRSSIRRRRPDQAFAFALSPVLFGSGIRLFEGVDAGRIALEPVHAEPTQRVTPLTYKSGSGNCLDLSAPPPSQQRGEILDALTVRKGERSGRKLRRALPSGEGNSRRCRGTSSPAPRRQWLTGPPRLASTPASVSSPVRVVTRRTAKKACRTTRCRARPRRRAPGRPGRGGGVTGAGRRRSDPRLVLPLQHRHRHRARRPRRRWTSHAGHARRTPSSQLLVVAGRGLQERQADRTTRRIRGWWSASRVTRRSTGLDDSSPRRRFSCFFSTLQRSAPRRRAGSFPLSRAR